MKGFYSFLQEAEDQQNTKVNDTLMIHPGRMNPMHLGHRDMLKYGLNEGGSDTDHQIQLSRLQDPKKNPLSLDRKVHYAQLAMPETKGMYNTDMDIRTPIQAMQQAKDKGYQNLVFNVGPDNEEAFKNIARYNPGFKNVDVISNPDMVRDLDLLKTPEGEMSKEDLRKRLITGLSASKMRKAAMNNDFEGFREGTDFGDHFKPHQKPLFEELKTAMGALKNQPLQFDNSYEPDADMIREMYKTGKLFVEGDIIEDEYSYMVGEIIRCGTNHLISVTEEGYMFKSFIHNVNLINTEKSDDELF